MMRFAIISRALIAAVGDLKGGADIVERVRHGSRRVGSEHVNNRYEMIGAEVPLRFP
jgi:hypothetical protein